MEAAGAIPASESTAAAAHGLPAVSQQAGGTAEPLPPAVADLLSRFPDVVNEQKQLPPVSHSTRHLIITTGQPVTAHFRRLDQTKLEAAKKIFAEWEAAGIVCRSDSCWSSPLHMVQKKDGSWRPVRDFRRLNLATVANKYPVPNMANFAHNLEDCFIFSTLDPGSGYLQVPLDPEAIPKTAIITPFGLFEFLRMPFGLKNTGMSFQRMMDWLLQGVPFAFCYIDDILVASKDMETHIQHLKKIFELLRTGGLVLILEKCCFARSEVDFLGHVISASGSRPLPSKVSAIQRHSLPVTVKDMQQFLGMLNFYRKFIPAAAQLLQPLTDCLRGGLAGSAVISWTDAMEMAFAAAKSSLAAAAVLAHPITNAQLSLAVDASNTPLGAVLQQRRPGSACWEPLGFFSRKLDKAESSYSAFDRELLAAFSGIRHFPFSLEGRPFELWSDLKPLLLAVRSPAEKYSPRQQWQMSYIAEYTGDLRHVPGKENFVADALSRPPGAIPVHSPVLSVCASGGTAGASVAVSPPSPPSSSAAVINFAAMAAAQASSAQLQPLPPEGPH